MKIAGIVPARSGSKGIKNKNLIKIEGKTLVTRAAEECLRTGQLDYVVVSSDSDNILAVAPEETIRIKRPIQYALDTSPIEETFHHALTVLQNKGIHPDMLVWLQPNIPIRQEGIVDRVIGQLKNSSRASAAVTCMAMDPRVFWSKSIDSDGFITPMFSNIENYRRQELVSPVLIDGSVVAFYVTNLDQKSDSVHSYLGDRVVPVCQKEAIYSLELDEERDLNVLHQYLTTKESRPEEVRKYFFVGDFNC